MPRYLMECNHVVIVPKGRAHRACCSRCNCERIKEKLNTVRSSLDGRYAVCGERKVKSRWDLPGFVYRPEQEYDVFFFGRSKRVLGKGGVNIERNKEPVFIDTQNKASASSVSSASKKVSNAGSASSSSASPSPSSASVSYASSASKKPKKQVYINKKEEDIDDVLEKLKRMMME